MKDLLVFDLQKFALHDGPGIRTTVFVKGCPLDCLWCHNPESKSTQPQLGILRKKCTSCGRCQHVCPNGVHTIGLQGEHEIDFSKCRQCGKCVDSCIHGALKIFGRRMSADEILKSVMKDMDFYRRSGGGLTVSGGEPMLQFDALLVLLKKAKENGLHVCLDTCGQAPTEKYAQIMPYVDVFLFDYKITNPMEHKKCTGVGNELILKNLDYLCSRGGSVFLRCPIIPGINDNDEHYQAIADLSVKYESGIRQVNLMTYHDMAKGKVDQIGQLYPLAELETVRADERKKIYERVASFGCRNLLEG